MPTDSSDHDPSGVAQLAKPGNQGMMPLGILGVVEWPAAPRVSCWPDTCLASVPQAPRAGGLVSASCPLAIRRGLP